MSPEEADRAARFMEDGSGVTWLTVARGSGAGTREPTALEQGRTADRTAGPPSSPEPPSDLASRLLPPQWPAFLASRWWGGLCLVH